MKALWLRFAVIALILSVLGFKYVQTNFFGPSDEVLVHEALDRAIAASREGRPGGVLEHLTSKFKMNSDEPGGAQIANFIKENHPQVEVDNYDAIVTGDTARILSPVRVKVSFLGHDMDQKVDNVTMIFKREEDHVWLVIPVKSWRLDQVTVPESWTPSGYGSQN